MLLTVTVVVVGWQALGMPGSLPARALAARVLGPVERLVGNRNDEVARLEAEKAALAAQVAGLRSQLGATKSIKGLVTFAATVDASPIVGRVIGRDNLHGPDPGIVTINVGSAHGVALNRSVVTAAGLVGRVVRVNTNTADVALLTNPAVGVSVRVGRASRLGSVAGATADQAGRHAGELSLELFVPGALAVGDIVTSLGSAENVPFLPGLPVGTVTAVDEVAGGFTATGAVAPVVDPSTLDVVAVLTPR